MATHEGQPEFLMPNFMSMQIEALPKGSTLHNSRGSKMKDHLFDSPPVSALQALETPITHCQFSFPFVRLNLHSPYNSL